MYGPLTLVLTCALLVIMVSAASALGLTKKQKRESHKVTRSYHPVVRMSALLIATPFMLLAILGLVLNTLTGMVVADPVLWSLLGMTLVVGIAAYTQQTPVLRKAFTRGAWVSFALLMLYEALWGLFLIVMWFTVGTSAGIR